MKSSKNLSGLSFFARDGFCTMALHCGWDGHLVEFCFRRKCKERLARELANKDRYRPSHGVPKPRLVSRSEGMVRTIYPRERREFVPRGEPPHRQGGKRVGFRHGEFTGRSFACGLYEYGGGGTIAALGPEELQATVPPSWCA
jgi:hypothetical protein